MAMRCRKPQKYLLFDELGTLVVDDGAQAMGVSGSPRVEAEVEGDVDGGELIPKLLLILHTVKSLPLGLGLQ